MKLEISVQTPDSALEVAKDGKLVVEKLLVKPGDTVQAGGHLILLRKK
jgi:biotin carboxyl carrier protein